MTYFFLVVLGYYLGRTDLGHRLEASEKEARIYYDLYKRGGRE